MKRLDYRITGNDMQFLQKFIGKKFCYYHAEQLNFSNSIFENVEICTDNGAFLITNHIYPVDYFGSEEDICLLKIDNIAKLPNNNTDSITKNVINRTIKEIQVIQENQKLFRNDKLIYDVLITRGLVFVMDDNYEILFEKTNPFVETLNVCRGYNSLSSQIAPFDDIKEEFEEPYKLIGTRNIQKI